MQQYTPNIGHLCHDNARRDAIHFAVAPVAVGDALLHPGDHVGLNSKGEASTLPTHIGIIDPFLTDFVHQGQRVWLFLYPGTVTSLRHIWQHPAFAPKLPSREEANG